MDKHWVLHQVHRLTGGLSVAEGSSAEGLLQWRQLLAEQLSLHPELDFAGLLHRQESAGEIDLAAALPAEFAQVESVLARPSAMEDAQPPLLFRRETAFRSALLGSSVPAWAAGMAPSQSFGPFIDTLGRQVWFDLFRRVRFVDLVLQGSSSPALRLPLRGLLTGRDVYRIEAGSVWIASALIAHDPALAGFFTGLRVSGGVLELSRPALVSGGQLELDVATTASLHLDLDQQAAKPSAGAQAGIDAAHATLNLPTSFDLVFSADGSVARGNAARCKAFGTEVRFEPTTQAPVWLAPLGQIVLPYKAAVPGRDDGQFAIEESLSALCRFAGSAAPHGLSGWLLPAAQIAPAQLGTAEGTGSLTLALGKGLSAKWKGLSGERSALQHPAVLLSPGTLSVIDFSARNLLGRQRWTLWPNKASEHHSDITLGFGKRFAFAFVSSVTDSEGWFAFCSLRAVLDRPVDGNGTPFKIESSLALAVMLQHGSRFDADLVDTDLLFDGKTGGPDAFERHALMLRNAYFMVSRPYSLFLAGRLSGDNTVARGVLALNFAIELYLPTLPDPYVASYTALLRDPQAIEFGHPTKALTAIVRWTEPPAVADVGIGAAEHKAGDEWVHVQFRFSPYDRNRFANVAAGNFRLAAQSVNVLSPPNARGGETIAADAVSISAAMLVADFASSPPQLADSAVARLNAQAQTGALQSRIASLAAHPLLADADAQAQIEQTLRLASAAQNRATGFDGLMLATGIANPATTQMAAVGGGDAFGRVGSDLFLLLDVSTRADQMGVSLGSALSVLQGRDDEVRLSSVAAPLSLASDSSDTNLRVVGMDVVAPARNLRALTLPQVSSEPVWNIPLRIEGPSDPADLITVAAGPVVYPNDGPATRIFSQSAKVVPIAPLPVTGRFLREFHEDHAPLRSLFALPFAMVAQADFVHRVQGPAKSSARLHLHMPHFDHLRGGLQIQALAPDSALPKQRSPEFPGFTLQLDNLRWFLFGLPLPGSTLGNTVKTIFNDEFGFAGAKPKVPLERIEFSGYGASMFSAWADHAAVVGEVSQTQFEVIVGRTAHEVVQVRSVMFPFAVHVVRTITLTRSANGYVFRSDSGWQPESDGFYDFSYEVNLDTLPAVPVKVPYEVHQQPVKGVSKVREIRDYPVAGIFQSSFAFNDPTLPSEVLNMTPAQKAALAKQLKVNLPTDRVPVQMQAVVFDADVHLDGVVSGGHRDPVSGQTIVQSRKMVGYVQLAPGALLVPGSVFAQLLNAQAGPIGGSLGGAVDCTIDIAHSQQRIRLSRVDVNPAVDLAGRPIFVSAARGSLILPPDGAWSVVMQRTDTGDVQPVPEGQSVPLIKPNAEPNFRIGHPRDAVRPDTSKLHFGVLQSTGTQKLLFDVPQFSPNQAQLKSAATYFADAYKLLNSKGVFPNVANALGLTSAERAVDILGEGLMKLSERTLDLGSLLPANAQYAFIDQPGILKVYAEYGAPGGGGFGKLSLGIDSAGALADRWKAALASIRVVVDLGPFQRLMWVDGNFNAASAAAPTYDKPHLQFGPVLQPVIDILKVLAALSGDDFDRGMDVGMSNSADNWEYKFNCSKEIPVIKFPSALELSINPNPPLKLEAGLRVGFYFNEVLSLPGDLKQLVPAAGAYVDFYGRLQVQCFTLGVASVYGVGQVSLGIAADSKAGLTLRMKFGFGAEVVVGLPVVANVSVLYMVEVEVTISASKLRVAGLMLFRGSAEICGGLVGITIQIEAGGAVERSGSGDTMLTAQVSFTIDVCLLWVIDINETDTWQETRQIA